MKATSNHSGVVGMISSQRKVKDNMQIVTWQVDVTMPDDIPASEVEAKISDAMVRLAAIRLDGRSGQDGDRARTVWVKVY